MNRRLTRQVTTTLGFVLAMAAMGLVISTTSTLVGLASAANTEGLTVYAVAIAAVNMAVAVTEVGLAAQDLVGQAPWLLNVNIPNRPANEIPGFKVARLGRRHAAEQVIAQTNPRGDTMYWIGNAGAAKDDAEGTDFHATALGYATITPLQVDLTDHERLPYWAPTAAQLSGVPAVATTGRHDTGSSAA